MLFLRRLLLRNRLRKQVKVKDVYTIYSICNTFGTPINAPIFKVVR